MKIPIFTTQALPLLTPVLISLALLPPLWCKAQTIPSDPVYSVVDRGPCYRVLQRTVSVTNNATGDVSQQVQGYTELEDGMHYLSNNIWVEAQDLIEITATGAQAVHGQMTATFNSDITSVGAITLTTATETFQSHPIGLFYTDYGSGKVAKIGTVQANVGTLYPPNVIVFSNVLSGLRADLMLVWAHNGFEQNLVLKQSPAAVSSDGGANWSLFNFLERLNGGGAHGVDIAIVPDGTVYFFWLHGDLGPGGRLTNYFRYASLSTNNIWSSAATIGPTLNSTNANGGGHLLRSSGANALDYFAGNSLPRVIYANHKIYLTYADLPSPNNGTTDQGDIFLLELEINWTNHQLSVTTGPQKVNNDRTQTDQWNPSITANPSGTELFIGYYSRQNDAVTNSWIMAYGVKAYITNGLSLSTFDCIPISLTTFQPLFAGTLATPNNVFTFDPVWPAAGVCLDTNSVYNAPWDGSSTCSEMDVFSDLAHGTTNLYVNFCADDYTWVYPDSNYFYFSWCDRTRTFANTRPDADVNLAKIKQ